MGTTGGAKLLLAARLDNNQQPLGTNGHIRLLRNESFWQLPAPLPKPKPKPSRESAAHSPEQRLVGPYLWRLDHLSPLSLKLEDCTIDVTNF